MYNYVRGHVDFIFVSNNTWADSEFIKWKRIWKNL